MCISTCSSFNKSLAALHTLLHLHNRSRLKNEMANLDQQGGGSRYISGSGEAPLQRKGCLLLLHKEGTRLAFVLQEKRCTRSSRGC